MIWSKPSSSPADPLPEVPLAGESDGAQVSIPARRGEAVALVGLADSGKTSFLFALRHAPMRPDSLRWLWPPSSLELARMTVHPGELLPATPSGYFSTSRLHTLHRKWRRPPSTPRAWWPPFLRPARKLTIPEISGENVRDFARGVDPDTLSPQRREVHRQFGEFLDACDEVLFLAGLRDSYFEGALQQDTVEEALASAASGLRTLIGEMHASRRGGARSKIFVTFLLTKRDAVKDNPGLDWVRLPQDVSALRRLAARPGFDHAGRLFREGDDGFVEFRLNRACDEAGSDVEVQEAIAIDFIACHAPHAAAALAGLAQLPGVSLRILTGKPFGYACRTGNGESAAPMPGRLESSMVWEALDDLVERSFRWRARRGIRAAGVAAAVLLLSLSILGPGLSWWSRSMASSAIAAQRVEAAQSWLALDDFVRERFLVTLPDGTTAGVYTGAPAVFRPGDLFTPNADGTLPDRVLVVDVFKDFPIGNSAPWLPRAIELDGLQVTPLLETPQGRVLQISPPQRNAGWRNWARPLKRQVH